MEELQLTPDQERTAWEFKMELAFHEGMPGTPPPDAESRVEVMPIEPVLGGAACVGARL